MIKVLKHLVLYKEPHFFASFPSITTCLPDQRRLLLFRRARDSRWLLEETDETSRRLKQLVDHVDSRYP